MLVAPTTLPPSVHAWPIGVGARYRPAAAPAAIRAGRRVGAFRCEGDSTRFNVHLELFANRQVIPIPAGIGVATPFTRTGADIRPSGCVYALHTTAPTGVVRVGSQGATLGGLFRLWGQTLGPRRLLSFRSARGVRVFVGGVERHGDPRAIRLTPHAQIVLEIRGYVAPHPFYLFPRSAP